MDGSIVLRAQSPSRSIRPMMGNAGEQVNMGNVNQELNVMVNSAVSTALQRIETAGNSKIQEITTLSTNPYIVREDDYLHPRTCKQIAISSDLNIPNSVKRSFAPLLEEYRKATDLKQKGILRNRIEEQILPLLTCGSLNPDIVDDVAAHIFQYNDAGIDNLLNGTNSLNVNVHANIACIVDAILNQDLDITDKPVRNTGAISRRIHNWFKTPRIIGAPSADGVAIATSLSDSSRMFVVKVSSNPQKDELSHEAYVGKMLNGLRKYTPCFMYTYGISKCSTVISRGKEIVNWCNPSSYGKGVNYLVLENIRNAKSANDFFTDICYGQIIITMEEVVNLLLLLFNGLQLAYNKLRFIHTDLHGDNVMIRTYDQPIAVPFYDNDNNVIGYISTKYVPYVIDFGRATITVDQIKFPYYYSSQDMQRDFYTVNDVTDIYKLICFIQYKMEILPETATYDGINYNLVREIRRDISSIFNRVYVTYGETGFATIRDRAVNRIRDPSDFYVFNFSRKPNLRINQVVQSLISQTQVLSIFDVVSKKLITAPLDDSLSNCEFRKTYSINNPPTTLSEYNDLIIAITDSGQKTVQKQQALQLLITEVDIQPILDQEFRDAEATRRIIGTYTDPILRPFNRDNALYHYTTKEGREQYLAYLKEIAERISKINEIESFIHVTRMTLTATNKATSDLVSLIRFFEGTLEQAKEYVVREKQIMAANITMINSNLRAFNRGFNPKSNDADYYENRDRKAFMRELDAIYRL